VSTRQWIPRALIQAQASPIKESPEEPQADPRARAVRGILILAFALGAIGAGAAVSGHEMSHHATGQPQKPDSSTSQTILHPAPWMY
jgi:hypothetical protein